MDHLMKRLDRVGISRETWPFTKTLLLRGMVIGVSLFLVLTDDRQLNLLLNLASLSVAWIWTYYHGLLSRRSVPLAFIEGLFLHLIAVGVGNVLMLLLGSPLVPWTASDALPSEP